MIRFLLVRHGQTAWNTKGRFAGQFDLPLDEAGHAQAAALANRLKDEQVDAIYSSDLSRAWGTALAIQSSLALRVDLKPDSRLREMNFGDWQGLTYPEIQRRNPEGLEGWEKDQLHNAPPHGETLLEFSERVKSVYKELRGAHADQTLILVAHGGSLQLLITYALGLPPEKYWQVYLSNASLSDLRVYELGAILNLLNDTSHLDRAL